MLRQVGRRKRLGHIAVGDAEQDVVVLKECGLGYRHELRVVDGRIGHRSRWSLRQCGYGNSRDGDEHQHKLHLSTLYLMGTVNGLPVGITMNATARAGASLFAEPNAV